MEPLAHSARTKPAIPAQLYAEHVSNVIERASKNAENAAKYCSAYGEQLFHSVRLAAKFHDLGKLNETNQKVLTSGSSREALPVNHVDAGVASIFQPPINNLLAATLIYAHHIGLPDFQDQRNNKAGNVLRDTSTSLAGRLVKDITDEELTGYLKMHEAAIPEKSEYKMQKVSIKPIPLLFRIALSCLVDADHYDTAQNYGEASSNKPPALLAAERLALLDAHIQLLSTHKIDERKELRNEVYNSCRDAPVNPSMYACDSPVGTGKTTAVMAHLLRTAIGKGLRRIFVVLPFTNIIDQSVEVYRKALVGIGERVEDVVAAHHHRAEFDDIDSRQFAFQWEAPIIVTTAVQFFETLASNHPASLRKLHQVPGSAVFIDEAHAALPSHLWPQAWQWLRELESKWGCYFVLGSGSLVRFWELEEFSNPPVSIPDLVSAETRSKALTYEVGRIQYRTHPDVLSLDNLVKWVENVEGPRLLIVNTVQSAAAISAEIEKRFGRKNIEHLSTSLCPRDRKITLDRVRARLQIKDDSNWTLVATSCVEAGIDFSFRVAFRERCGLNNLIQIGGRVNRKGEDKNAIIWDFQLRHEGLLKRHPSFDKSVRVLGDLFDRGLVGPECCTDAMRYEIRSDGIKNVSNEIIRAERNLQFPIVAKEFNVIDSYTVTVIIDPDLVEKLNNHEKIDRNLIQSLSVQVWGYRKEELGLVPVAGFPGMFSWSLKYDNFLGYMAGVLQMEIFKSHGGTVI